MIKREKNKNKDNNNNKKKNKHVLLPINDFQFKFFPLTYKNHKIYL